MRRWRSERGNEENNYQRLPSAEIYIFLLLRSRVMTRQTGSKHELNWFSRDPNVVVHFSQMLWSCFEGRVQMSSCCSMATDAREPCLIVLHSHSQAAGFQGSDANGRRCSECNTNARRGWTGSEGYSLTVGFQHAAFVFCFFFHFLSTFYRRARGAPCWPV